jgi:hypothetical protein
VLEENPQEMLSAFLERTDDLNLEERQLVVNQALVLLEGVYVHLPLKRAMHAVDSAQRLRLLRRRLRNLSTRQFHDEMISIFTELRDLHTNYMLPVEPFQNKVAFLPFLLEEFFDDNKRKYMVSKTYSVNGEHFKPGVVVTHWNGIPIGRAVALNADRQGGSNEAARHARGLQAMTFRPLILSSPPDEEWVVLRYFADGQVKESNFDWKVLDLSAADARASTSAAGDLRVDPYSVVDPAARMLGIDIDTEVVGHAKQLLFAPQVTEQIRKMGDWVKDLESSGTFTAAFEPAGLGLGFDMSEISLLPQAFKFRTVQTQYGTFGYIRIFTFNVSNANVFVNEFARIAALLPQNGLIIDVRSNGGGNAVAGESLLQVLTPKPIEPERFHFISTPLTLEFCKHNTSPGSASLGQWKDSIEQSVETGATHSQGFPLLPVEEYNRIGQCYYGPVVLITDALCYSTTDIFAAGFQDHKIGPILGTSENTGAGGANVWPHQLLSHYSWPGSPFSVELPQKISFRVAFRRSTRVGDMSGVPLEDLGVIPDAIHHMTQNDQLKDNQDLIARAGEILASMKVCELSARLDSPGDGKVKVSVSTKNLSRLDIYLDQRPRLTLDISDGTTPFGLPAPPLGPHILELRGFNTAELCVVKRLPFEL